MFGIRNLLDRAGGDADKALEIGVAQARAKLKASIAREVELRSKRAKKLPSWAAKLQHLADLPVLPAKMALEDVPLPNRARWHFYDHRDETGARQPIKTVADIRKISNEDLLRIPSIGDKTFAEIRLITGTARQRRELLAEANCNG